MELSQLADKYLGSDGGSNLSSIGPCSIQINERIKNEDYSTSLIATIFWQAFVYSDAFLSTVSLAGLDVTDYASCLLDGEGSVRYEALQGSNSFFVLSHGKDHDWPSFDLIVFDRNLSGRDPFAFGQVEISPEELMTGWARFVRNFASCDRRIAGFPIPELPGTDNVDVIFNCGAGAAREAYEAQRFGVLFVGTPELIPTTGSAMSPFPPFGVCLNADGRSISNVGLVAKNRQGKLGVTTALHPFGPDGRLDLPAALHTISQIGGEVWIGTQKGSLVSADIDTDSCFIEVLVPSSLSGRTNKEPLRDTPPKGLQMVTFESSIPIGGRINTVVIGWSLHLPFVVPSTQCVILTTSETTPANSGSALIDQDNNVLGFCFVRSGLDQVAEFSMWIWAEAVYLAHGLGEAGSLA